MGDEPQVRLLLSDAERLDAAIRLSLQRLGNAIQDGLSKDGAAEAFTRLNCAYTALLAALDHCAP